MEGMGAKLSEIAKRLELKNFTESLDLEQREVHVADVNRPSV